MIATIPISYSDVRLDRASAERKDQRWIQRQLKKSDMRMVCLHNDRNLTTSGIAQAKAVYIERGNADGLLDAASETIFLGLKNATPYFAVDLSDCNETDLDTGDGEFIDLRQVGPLLEAGEASLLAYARALVYWHAHNHYCGVCGNPTASGQGGHTRVCADVKCAREVFPRTDPAVIVLVEDFSQNEIPRCLLGRNKRFPTRMFSTLAGFVDPGEALEQTVKREVFEEVGIRVGNVRYQASQPWPFPASIMLGFRATAESTEINTDTDEIEEAYWFSPQQIRSFGEWTDGGSNNCLPRGDSIARYLVDSWVRDVG